MNARVEGRVALAHAGLLAVKLKGIPEESYPHYTERG
jgi:hypothetical protein